MAIKTFINGQENGVITYVGDTEPCAVYVNRERQDNISYIPTLAEGADSVSYKSEYKNNLRTLRIEGNTEQEQGSVNLFDQNQMVDGTKFTKEQYNGFNCIKVETKANSLNCEFPVSIPSDKTVSMSLDCANPNGTIDFYTFLKYEDGTLSSALAYRTSTTVSTEFAHREKTITTNQNVVALQFKFYGNYPAFYLKDIMLNIGNPLPYEPYVPPISIANPRAITNCGNSQVDIVARGVNLFDISKVNGAARANTATPDVAGNVAYGTITDGVLNLAYGVYDKSVIWTGSKIPIKQGGKYYISFDFMCESSMNGTYAYIYISFRNLTKGTRAAFATIADDNVRDVWQTKTPSKYIEITDDWVGDDVYLQLQASGTANQHSKMPIYAKNIMISYGEPKPYQPYFNSSVSIPANVVLESGANDTLLELAKIGDVADTITIDRVNNEVKYTQRICRVRPFVGVGGTLWYDSYTSQYYNVDLWEFDLDKYTNTDVMKCEFAKVAPITEAETEFCVEIVSDSYMYIGFPKSLGITTTEALDNYLTQTQGWGLSIEYVLEYPIEWTITDNMGYTVNLKKNLLDLAKNTKNQTNIIEITSTPSVSKTSVNYAKWGGVPNENNT